MPGWRVSALQPGTEINEIFSAEDWVTTLVAAAGEPDIKAKLLLVAQYAHHQPTAAFTQQVADDKAFFAGLIRELDIKLE